MPTAADKHGQLLCQRVGRLVIESYGPRTNYGAQRFLCRCDCGKIKAIKVYNLLHGTTLSCGCLAQESARILIKKWAGKNATHRQPPGYSSWVKMKERCYNVNHAYYYNYGGRGITVCERWKNSFENFYQDMGPRPHSLSLDRINGNGDYEPANCRWATRLQQRHNRRTEIYAQSLR